MPKTTRKRSRGNGEGSIYYSQAKKKWIAQYTTGKNADGKQTRKTFYADTRKGVKLKLDSYIKGEIPESKRTDLTIHEILTEAYDYKFKTNIISANTYGRAKETTKRIDCHYIGKKPIQTISDKDIMDFLMSVTNYSNSVIKKIYGQLKYALDYCVNNEVISKNPLNDKTRFAVPKSNKPTKKIRALTVDEQKQLLEVFREHPDIHHKTQMLISLYSGMRMGEVNALSLADVNMENRTVKVERTLTRDENYKTVVGQSPKTYAGIRTIQMNDSLYDIFTDFFNSYEENTLGILFINRNKADYISTSSINSQFQRIAKKYCIAESVNAHMLRHTFATRAIEAGMSAKALQKILGHADITVTLNTYCDVFEKFETENNDRLTKYFDKQGLAF